MKQRDREMRAGMDRGARRRVLWLCGAVLAFGAGCVGAPESLPPCTSANSPDSFCGLANPEDLDLLPGGWMVVSQMGSADRAGRRSSEQGSLLAIRLVDGKRQLLFPGAAGEEGESPAVPGEARAAWGDPACTTPPDAARFLPHGIAVGTHASGRPLLAVVNHGGREAVELFEIDREEGPGIAWRGCVPMPEGMMANDLALFSDGGFVVTKFMAPMQGMGPSMLWNGIKLMAGWETGAVYRWTPGGELVAIANSAGSAPNGIAISHDETELFVAEWGDPGIYRLRLDVEGEPLRTRVALGHRPDNLTWTRDGKLLVAGQAGAITQIVDCGEIEEGGCGLDYGVYRVDPISLEVERLWTGKGAASVALEVDDAIYVGAFAGDEIERFANPH